MKSFNYSIPTQVFFGQGQIKALSTQLKEYGAKVLMVYGGGSIKKIGLYDEVVDILKNNGFTYWELPGVEPNPRIDSVREGVKLCKEHHIEVILAVGGGSVIDCAKIIAAGYYTEADAWDLMIRKATIQQALPIATILTLSATGSEMDPMAVISNLETNQKLGMGHPSLFPKFSILDPTYTFTVPANQTAAGTADIMSHIFEVYFSPTKEAYLQNRMAEALLKTCIHYGPIAMREPENYEARANLMWASSLAINGILTYGKETNWSAHPMEHELSAYFDITHGVGLAILTPPWMDYVLGDETVGNFYEYGVNVWGLDPNSDQHTVARESIRKTREFFSTLDIPSRLRDVGILEDKLEVMANAAAHGGTIGNFKPLNTSDILEIYKAAF